MTDEQIIAAMITAYEDEPGVRQFSAMRAALAVAKTMIREAALREAKEAVNKVLLDTDRPVYATIAWAAIDILSE